MSVKQMPNGRWRARVKIGGIQITSKVFDRQRDAERWEREERASAEAALDSAWTPTKERTMLGTVLDRWLATRPGTVAETTAATDRHMIKHVPEVMRRKPVGRITPSDVATMYANLMRGGMTHATTRRARQTFNSAMTWAERQGYVRTSPARGVTEPRGTGADERREMRPVLASTLAEIVTAQREWAGCYADLTSFAWHTGLRSGELRALRVCDIIDVPIPAILVSRSAPDAAKAVRKVPKGRKPRRVPLDVEAQTIAARWSEGRPADAILFPSNSGTILRHRALLRRLHWHAVKDVPGTGQGHRWHELRHGAAVRWLLAGIDPKTVQAWLGHASATTTLDVYSHYLGGDADRAALARLVEPRGHLGDTKPDPTTVHPITEGREARPGSAL